MSSFSPLSLHPLFSANAILQAGVSLPLKGGGPAATAISVHLAGRRYETISDKEGHWEIHTEAFPAGGPHPFIVESGTQKLTEQVWFGDVWLASGQSNMMWPLEETWDGPEELASANDPLLRFFHVAELAASTPRTALEGCWVGAQQRATARYSAVAYHFAKALRRAQGIPIGIVQAAIGGTLMSCWKSAATLQADPQTSEYWKAYETAKSTYAARFQQWEASPEIGQRPPPPERLLPSGYFNGMISPLVGFPVKGVIWYQGEGNNKNAENYERESIDLIHEWRQLWSQPEMPFFFVQLAGFAGHPWANHNWPYLRDAQLGTWRHVPHTGMAVAIDAGEKDNIHPRNKQPVGKRLARWALSLNDGGKTVPSGPLFRQAAREAGNIRVTFDYAADGLVTKDNAPVRGFQIAGSDGIFRAAEARIEGCEIILPSAGSSPHFFLRYAWAGFPEANLYNTEALPAVPFRTDHTPFVAE